MVALVRRLSASLGLTHYFVTAAIAWTLFHVSSMLWIAHEFERESLALATIQARASSEKDIAYRRWVLMHGGVYVPVTETMQPNPFLTDHPERDVVTPSGRVLTLMNSARMMRQVHEFGSKEGGLIARIAAVGALQPQNEADHWERAALEELNQGATEVLSLEESEGGEALRLIRPIRFEKSCLKCHERKEVGEEKMRGGISISVPMAPFRAVERKNVASMLASGLLLWAAGMSALYFVWHRLRRGERERAYFMEALRESERRFREMLESVSLVAVMMDTSGRVTFCNDYLLSLTGWEREEVLGQNWFQMFLPEGVREEVEAMFIDRLSAGDFPAHYRNEILTRSGERRLIAWNNTILRDPHGAMIGGTALGEDITQRVRAEEELKQSEERLRILFECAPDPYYLNDTQGRFVDGNRAAEAITGYSREELVGKSLLEAGILVPEDLPNAAEVLRRNAEGQPSGPDVFTLVRKGGERVFLEIRTYPTTVKGRALILGIARDITERRRAEEEKNHLEAQLRQAQKMEAIGTLAGGIAHDFNNILSAVLGYSDLARIELPKDSPVRYHIEQIQRAGFRARDLVKQILAFSHQGERERRPVKMGLLVKETVKLLRASIPSTVEIQTSLYAPSDFVLADATQMHQVLMNLCTNAWQAMREGGGTLGIGLRETLEADIPHMELEVKDTGCGIPPEVIERIFDPYFTTKPRGEGTGLGLAVAQGIIKAHGGAITAESIPGAGTTFRVTLPLLRSIVPEPAQEHAPLPSGKGHILFVDDEPALVEIGRTMLERLGYRVTSRVSSVEALEAFRAQPDRFDLVVTDYAMPKMSGLELARELVRIRPGIPILMCTGFSEEMYPERLRGLGIEGVILKPIIARELADAVHRLLDTGS